MSNFEMKYTVRLYDPDLVVEIGNLYKAHSKEFRNKNEFMTCLIRLGVDALKAKPPTAPASAAVPPAAALNKLYDEMRKIESIADETGKFLKVQGRACTGAYEDRRSYGSKLQDKRCGNIQFYAQITAFCNSGSYSECRCACVHSAL